MFETTALTAAAVFGITLYAMVGFKQLEDVQVISMIGPAVSAIGLVLGVMCFFVFAPNDKLGCDVG